jgi:hypothetical protein
MLREDAEFTQDMVSRQLPQRRLGCPNGHSMYTGLPRAIA